MHTFLLRCCALLMLTTACAESGPTTPPPPEALLPAQAGPLVGEASAAVTVTVRVVDAAQRGVSGVQVTFTLPAGGGSLSSESAVSNDLGEATVTWTLPATPGVRQATASVEGLAPIQISADVKAGAAVAFVLASGDTITGIVGAPADTILAVRILDNLGNGVAGRVVTFTPSGGSGSVSATQITTDSDGLASTTWTLGTASGVQHVTIAPEGFSSVTAPAVALLPPNSRRVAVAPNLTHACRLDSGGIATCWGNNTLGSLGTGDVLPRTGPVVAGGSERFTAIAIGGRPYAETGNTCGLTPAGATWCWGPSSNGVANPVRRLVNGGPPFQQIGVGGDFGCGLDRDGFAWCWGTNALGQLGVASIASSETPVRVSASLRFRVLAVGGMHTCGLTRTGAVYCWGANGNGQIGDGTTTNRFAPTRTSNINRLATLDAGSGHTCGIALGGALWCWGRNASSEVVGNGVSTTTVALPVETLPGTTFDRVFAGAFGTCGIRPGGAALCWGANESYRLGDSTTTVPQLQTPKAIIGNFTFSEIRLGGTSSCGLTTTNEVRCWGSTFNGILAIPDPVLFTTPQAVVGGHTFTQVGTGDGHGCGLKADGTLWCWGFAPRRVEGAPLFTAIGVGEFQTCGLDLAGSIWCTTRNGDLIAGLFTSATKLTLPPMSALSTGYRQSCGLTATGVAWCWGAEYTQDIEAPLPVSAPEPLISVSAGMIVSCGIGASGAGYCWPRRDGTTPPQATLIPGGHTFTAVATFDGSACFIANDGGRWCWNAGILAPPVTPLPISDFTPSANVRCGTTAAGVSSCWSPSASEPAGTAWRWTQVDVATADFDWQFGPPATAEWGPPRICALTSTGAAYCWGQHTVTTSGAGGLGIGVSRHIVLPNLVPW
jgi:alpha-tubulin suppressor-like RCC1 family protein